MSQVLVVANQTIGGSELHESIKARASAGPCRFTLLVPATPSAHTSSTVMLGHVGSGLPPRSDASALEGEFDRARRRLEYGLEQLRPLGFEVDGEVGDPNPLKAIGEALARKQYDEIILSTLPSGISRWLSQDLPHKVKRKFHLPVAVVTATAKPPR
jgi:GABA permease